MLNLDHADALGYQCVLTVTPTDFGCVAIIAAALHTDKTKRPGNSAGDSKAENVLILDRPQAEKLLTELQAFLHPALQGAQ